MKLKCDRRRGRKSEKTDRISNESSKHSPPCGGVNSAPATNVRPNINMLRTDLTDDYKTIDSNSQSGRKNFEKWDVFAAKKYSHKIKVTNWWYHREAYPKDCDDGVHSAYKRWGTYNDKSVWMTETMQRMKEGLGDPELHDFKERAKHIKMLNFLSFPETLKTRKDLLPDEIKKILPELPRDLLTLRYTTTNQAHYKKVHILPK